MADTALADKEMADKTERGRFWRIAGAGVGFQGGSAAVDSATIIAGFVHALTGSSVAVGLASATLRFGWLFPQLFVGYLAQGRRRRMPFYMVGAFGRAACLAMLAAAVAAMGGAPPLALTVVFFVLWTGYSFVSGIVAVPYNDIVGRSIPSHRRSRMLAWRFFGGGLLGLIVAAAAHRLLGQLPFLQAHAAVFAIGAALLLVSSVLFVSAGEPDAPPPRQPRPGFLAFLRDGGRVYREDARFRLFLQSQWLGGAALMALPFYVIQARAIGLALLDIPLLLAAQTAGALASNALWGRWGDRRGKQSLLEGVAVLRIVPPVAVLFIAVTLDRFGVAPLTAFGALFFCLGGLVNGTTIAMLGYLMEISPDDRRPAYSGYFNAMVAPASLLPILGGIIAEVVSLPGVFVLAVAAGVLQYLTIRRLRRAGGDAG